jgi:hypothetical protein
VGRQNRRAFSTAEVIYGAVCMMAAAGEPSEEEPVNQWMECISKHNGPPNQGLHAARCEPSTTITLKSMISGGCGIGTSTQDCSIIADACTALTGPNCGFSVSTVIHYQAAVKKGNCPAPNHGGMGGVRLNTVGGARAIAKYIEQNRHEIALALYNARAGEGGGGGGGMSAAQCEQRASAAAKGAEKRKADKAAETRAALMSGAQAGASSASAKTASRAAAAAAGCILSSSPGTARASLEKFVGRGDIKRLKLSMEQDGGSGSNDTAAIVEAYKTAKAQKNNKHARAMLSVLSKSRKPSDVLCLFVCDPCDGDTVRLSAQSDTLGGGAVRYGQVDGGMVHVFRPAPAYSDLRFDSTVEQAAVLRAAMAKDLEPLLRVPPAVLQVLARGAGRGGGADVTHLLLYETSSLQQPQSTGSRRAQLPCTRP